jgi:hypothetical protein
MISVELMDDSGASSLYEFNITLEKTSETNFKGDEVESIDEAF